ncbi:permease prefix domain 1-containing protein [Promicromonospora thailandica]|uniref:Uncharacterized protein n=1 Tax=Promicromonospora thailandica TaxID=765201 RepID=A0A9X2G426_9MICO|nr:permease prefix domain 1-containing protein [Promicromonospora thailandica]MCP2266429.1 hypothetical protein [Promicromonospora thailandica]
MTNISVHRLLDDAFAGIAVTPDVQDLKEEIRANLLDRVAELTAAGVAPDDAAQRAVDELGDVRALVTDATADGGTLAPATPTAAVSNAAAAAAGQRVPVQRRYMLGMIAAVVVLLLAVLPIVSVIALLAGEADALYLPAAAALFLAGPAVGWIVGASLERETPARYGMPRRRALAYGAATAVLVTGVVAGVEAGLLIGRPFSALAVGVPLLVAGGAWLAYLLATQTNRRKPWLLELEREHARAADRFEREPETAARFGIYTVVIWGVTAAAFLAVGSTVGWLWALLPVLLGVATFMLVLARMLFGRPVHGGEQRVRPVP